MNQDPIIEYRKATGWNPPGEKPSDLRSFFLQLKDADLEQLSKALGIKLAIPMTGKVTTDLQVSVPLNKLADKSAYRFKGTVTASTRPPKRRSIAATI